ncbi:hypothetical protein A2U01_0091659, partial [Trifolium medium]|nr:hypothetical protein [Trifolium medium]
EWKNRSSLVASGKIDA